MSELTYFGWCFLIFSVVGFFVDTLGDLVINKVLEKRGILFGPWLPIYGFGGVLILVVGKYLAFNPVYMFLGTVAAATALEYVTGWLLMRIFERRWWNYLGYPLNLDGFVCLPVSLFWGFLGLVEIYVLMRPINHFVLSLSAWTNWLLLGFGVLYVTDVILTLISVLRLRKRWQELLSFGGYHLLKAHLNIQEQLSHLPRLSFNQRRLLKTFSGLGEDFLSSLKKSSARRK